MVAVTTFLVVLTTLIASPGQAAEIDLPAPDVRSPIRVSADRAERSRSGGFDVWVLSGDCLIRQGQRAAQADEAVIWVPFEATEPDTPKTVVVYLEGNVRVVHLPRTAEGVTFDGAGGLTDRVWLGRFRTTVDLIDDIATVTEATTTTPAIVARGLAARQQERNEAREPTVGVSRPSNAGVAATSDLGDVGSMPTSDGWVAVGDAAPTNRSPVTQTSTPIDQAGSQLWSGPSTLSSSEVSPPSAGNRNAMSGGVTIGRASDGLRGRGDVLAGNGPALDVPLARIASAADPSEIRLGQVFPSPANSGPIDPADRYGPPLTVAPDTASGVRFRKILIRPRANGTNIQANSFPSPTANEQIAVLSGGVRLIVEDAATGTLDLGRIDLETDRVVVWARGVGGANLLSDVVQAETVPLELYLEGNIVFRQGDRVIYANRMYFDVTSRRGTILGAEVLTPVPDYQGLVRLKADVLQQIDEQTLVAYGAAATSSRLGVPTYWIQSDKLTFTDARTPAINPVTGQPAINELTGEPTVDHRYQAQSDGNTIFLGGYPVFYWPTLRTDLTKPNFYIDEVAVRNDRVFGTQLLVDFDLYQLLGIAEPPVDSKWELSLDALSQRGLGVGTNYRYRGDTLFGLPGPYRGEIDAWGIYDFGQDNLGLGRRDLDPETRGRGRVLATHRQLIAGEYQLTAELGLISDRNFLEQYYEREWDTRKDEITGVELKRTFDNQSIRAAVDLRTNDFFTQTENLPRFDHFVVGETLFDDRVTWFGHSQIGYAKLKTASAPDTNPEEIAVFDPLAWEVASEGVRASTRQELDLPIDVGPARITPFVAGEVAFWGEALDGNSLLRGLGQTGVRGSLPMWSVDRNVQSRLFNLDGLAHKVIFDAEILYADASQDLGELPLYDQIDDDSQEFARRRFYFTTFGGLPGGNTALKYDERFYAQRMGLQSYATSPSVEVADDLLSARLGVRQRWQTKRGPAGAQHTVDYISLDLEGTVFPRSEDQNFGAPLGLANYDFRWAVGDRVTILSDGLADFFGQGLRTASIGTLLTRPEQGSLYLGFRSINGPINSQLVSSSISYRMSDKWIGTAGLAYDFGDAGSIGQSIGFTRIGESFLVQVGVNSDISRGSVGFQLAVEPRFLPRSKLGNVGGVQVPPPGAFGLE